MEDRPTHARAIVIHQGSIMLLGRNRRGHEYFSFPGGRVEPGEDPAQTVVREVAEETSIQVRDPQLVYDYRSQKWGRQFFYRCTFVSGEPKVSPGTNEAADNAAGANLYKPQWIPIKNLEEKNVLPAAILGRVLKDPHDNATGEVEVINEDWA